MSQALSLQTIFRPTILLTLALMAVIVMMILPMPSWVLDGGAEDRVQRQGLRHQ